jgi:hypothetical protein
VPGGWFNADECVQNRGRQSAPSDEKHTDPVIMTERTVARTARLMKNLEIISGAQTVPGFATTQAGTGPDARSDDAIHRRVG